MNTRDILKTKLLHFVQGNTLDLGAGTAKYKEDILRYAEKYTACDVEPGKGIDVVCDVHKLPFKDEEFETIVCTQVFEHVKEPWVVAEEAYRVLKKGGRILFTVPFCEINHDMPRDFYRYTEEGACHLFERVGMKILKSGSYGGPAAVLLCALKFRFFDPYQKRGFFRINLWRVIEKALLFLDRFIRPGRMYECVYLLAQK